MLVIHKSQHILSARPVGCHQFAGDSTKSAGYSLHSLTHKGLWTPVTSIIASCLQAAKAHHTGCLHAMLHNLSWQACQDRLVQSLLWPHAIMAFI